jgi:hypothetical protein
MYFYDKGEHNNNVDGELNDDNYNNNDNCNDSDKKFRFDSCSHFLESECERKKWRKGQRHESNRGKEVVEAEEREVMVEEKRETTVVEEKRETQGRFREKNKDSFMLIN